MNSAISTDVGRRQSERRDFNADQHLRFDATEPERRGYDDRRSDAEWRFSWLRARVAMALRD